MWIALLCLPALGLSQPQDPPQELARQQAQAQQQREALRKQLETVQQKVQARQTEERSAFAALQKSEQAISVTVRKLDQLDKMLAQFEAELAQTQTKMDETHARIDAQQEVLSEQLRSQYASGINAWSALLAGEDPQQISRDLGYLEFVTRARSEAIANLQTNQAELLTLQQTQKQQMASVEQTKDRLAKEREQLASEQAQRAKVHAQVQAQLTKERKQAQTLAADEKRLSVMVEDLSIEMDRWRAQQAQAAQQAEHQAAREAVHDAAREAALAALPKGKRIARGQLLSPASGAVLARYGSRNPDGGSWRGVLIRVNEGDPVKVVSEGTVVFSKWMAGYGNLIIVDHDDEFLSVYAYNQSLLKDVGDSVRAGDVIAKAGNTGGQLDSALYFELRHQGKPLDPLLYIKKL